MRRKILLLASPVLVVLSLGVFLEAWTMIYTHTHSGQLRERQQIDADQANLMRDLLGAYYQVDNASSAAERSAAKAKAENAWKQYQQRATRAAQIDKRLDGDFRGAGKILRNWQHWLFG